MKILQILALAKKEFLALLRDNRSRMILVGPPIMQMLIFGFAASYDLNNVPVAIYNQDPGGASRAYLSQFEGSPNFKIVATITHDAEIAPLINNRRILMVLNIQADFSANLLKGEPGIVQAIFDGRNSNTAMIAMNYLSAMTMSFSRDWNNVHGRAGPRVELNLRNWYNENLQSRWFIIPGILGLLVLVVTLLVTALSVAREREAGTFDQLLVTPMRPFEILIGKAIPGLVVGLVEATVILLVIVYIFDIPLRGNIGALYFGIFLFLLSATGIGLMISAISVTQQQAILGAFLFMVPAVTLSGFSTPIANMPEAIQWITYVNPLRYFLVILRGVFLEGNSYGLLMDQYWPMLIISITTLGFAGWLFKHRMY